MNIYVVSIEEEQSLRWKGFIQQDFIKSLTQGFVKVGVRGSDLPTKQYFDLGVKGREIALTPGEVGCTLSHLQALEHFLASAEEYALILEDDAIFPQDLQLDKITDALEQMKFSENFIFSLGGIQMKECRKVRGELIRSTFLNKTVLRVVPDYYHRVCYTVAYVVDRKMAETLLAYHRVLRRADDWSYLYDFNPQAKIYMSYVVDHPVINAGCDNPQLSLIEVEREARLAFKKSRYGSTLRKNIAKLFYKKYCIRN